MMLCNVPANLENSAVAAGLEKGQFSFQSQRKAMPKDVQTTAQLHSSHTLAKVCLVKAVVFPVAMYGCESWTEKKAEH